MQQAIAQKVKKVVMTGSATSVVGQHPVKDPGFVYRDAYDWVDAKAINRPNEKAKILSEKVAWTAIRKQEETTLTTLLPYFMVGPPLYKDLLRTNSSCQAIGAVLNNLQYGFPEIQLPIVDVRDVAAGHIQAMLLDSLRSMNGRYLVASESLWFSEILKTLKSEPSFKVKTRILGPLTLAVGKLINPEIANIMPFVHTPIQLEAAPFERDFAINRRDVRISLLEMAQQIVKL